MNLGLGFNLFAQSDSGIQISDIITIPGFIWMFGLAVWVFAAIGRRQGKVQRWKWFLAYGLLLFAAYAAWSGLGSDADKQQGFGPFLTDLASRAQYGYKRLVIAVWASFLLPVLTIPVLWFFDKRETKHMSELVS